MWNRGCLRTRRRHVYSNIHQLFSSLSLGNVKQLVKYLEKGDPNITGNNGNTLLIDSIVMQDADKIDILIKYHCDVNKRNDQGNSPLHIAVCQDDAPLCKKLIDAGADVSTVYNRTSPLLHAVQHKNVEMIKLLLENGADCNAKLYLDEGTIIASTPLTYALKHFDDDVIVDTILCYNRVDFNSQLYLCYKDKCQIGFSFFLAKGANPFTRFDSVLSVFEQIIVGLVLMHRSHKSRFKFDDWGLNQIIMEYGHVTKFSHQNLLLSELINCETVRGFMTLQIRLKLVRKIDLYSDVLGQVTDHLITLGLPMAGDILRDSETSLGCGTADCTCCRTLRMECRKRIRTSPNRLFQQCRSRIRSLWTYGVTEKVGLLPLPPRMKDLLCFSDVDYVEMSRDSNTDIPIVMDTYDLDSP